VPAGHDKFPVDLVRSVLGQERTDALSASRCLLGNVLNMTHLGLVFSYFINGVSMRHEEVSRGMFPDYPINSVTNGVHAVTWTSEPFARLYDRHIPEWRRDSMYLRYAIGVPLEEVRQAHDEAKANLLDLVRQKASVKLRGDAMTIGFARRATGYKRADLLFADTERLRRMAGQIGPLQVVYAGKAHPRDDSGKAMIRAVYKAAEALRGTVEVVYLADYDMALARHVCSGVDVWLNTPQRPHEASGTSGMKAALNGVPSLSVLDGWWVEGHFEGATGWSVGDDWAGESDPQREIESLYGKLEGSIMPVYYRQSDDYARIMRSAIAINGSYYNAERMMALVVREGEHQLQTGRRFME
jgi:starch phosphorylase